MRFGKMAALSRRSGLFRRAVSVYILLAVLPIVLVTVSATILFTRRQAARSARMVEQYAGQSCGIIEERLNTYRSVFFDLLVDRELIARAAAVDQAEHSSYSADRSAIRSLLENAIYTYGDVRGAAFIADNGEYVSYSKWYGSASELVWADEAERRALLDSVTELSELTYIAMENLGRYADAPRDFVVMMGMPVRDLVTKRRSGVLVFALSQSILLFGDGGVPEYGIGTVVTDEEGRVMAGAPDAYINGALDDYLSGEFRPENVTVWGRAISETKWTLVSLIDNEAQIRDNRRFIGNVILLMVVITAIFFAAVYSFLWKYIGEVQEIAAAIGNFDAERADRIEIEMDADDELHVIAGKFNQMTERVNLLVETLKKRNEEIRESETNRRHAEIKALEAQINPHFLYNTLDSINWRAIDDGEEEISNMLGMLGSLLRYSISNIDTIVLLRAEIEWLKKYVYLQRDRFNNSFDCVYAISDEAMDFPVYKMLLQPMIENSILHAFEGMESGGLIEVSGSVLEDGRLLIAVRDNGAGMTPEVLAKMQREMTSRGVLNSESIGISNVVNRLNIYYQGEADISISSEVGNGTEVVIRLPDKRRLDG